MINITIRQETPADYAIVEELVYRAFDDIETAEYLKKVRTKETFIPELSFVAILPDR